MPPRHRVRSMLQITSSPATATATATATAAACQSRPASPPGVPSRTINLSPRRALRTSWASASAESATAIWPASGAATRPGRMLPRVDERKPLASSPHQLPAWTRIDARPSAPDSWKCAPRDSACWIWQTYSPGGMQETPKALSRYGLSAVTRRKVPRSSMPNVPSSEVRRRRRVAVGSGIALDLWKLIKNHAMASGKRHRRRPSAGSFRRWFFHPGAGHKSCQYKPLPVPGTWQERPFTMA